MHVLQVVLRAAARTERDAICGMLEEISTKISLPTADSVYKKHSHRHIKQLNSV